jgi:hypothetical protein
MQADHDVTLIAADQANWRPTADGLSFTTYWTTAQPLRPYSWAKCPWASIADEYQDDDEPRYWISRQNQDPGRAVRRRRIALHALDGASGSRRLESVGLEPEGASVHANIAPLAIGQPSGLREEISTQIPSPANAVQPDTMAEALTYSSCDDVPRGQSA